MLPCAGDGCKLCAEHIGAQLRYVVTAAEVSTHRVGLLEVGHTVAMDLRDLAVRCDGMRGMIVELSKHSFSRNSRMELRLVERVEGPWWREIEEPDRRLALHLCFEKGGHDLPEFSRPESTQDKVDRFKGRRPAAVSSS